MAKKVYALKINNALVVGVQDLMIKKTFVTVV